MDPQEQNYLSCRDRGHFSILIAMSNGNRKSLLARASFRCEKIEAVIMNEMGDLLGNCRGHESNDHPTGGLCAFTEATFPPRRRVVVPR